MSHQSSQKESHPDISISSLGTQICSLSFQISTYLEEKFIPNPTFEVNTGVTPADSEYEALRASLNDLALDLLLLVNGPKTTLRDIFFSHYDLAAMQVAVDRGFFKHIPLPPDSIYCHDASQVPSMSVAEIAAKSNMDEDRTAAILKLLASRRIFQQVIHDDSGIKRFRHTPLSASLAQDTEWHALGDMKLDDMFRASSELSAAISRSPCTSDVVHSAFHQRFGMPMYKYYEKNPDKGKRFAHAMSSWSQVNERDTELRDSFSWDSLGSGKVVDVGGGSGHISIKLAREFPLLRFIVQDISPVQLGHGPERLLGRVSFQQHDFFSPQTIYDASAFFLRQILHNYNDEDSIRIIRALVPALEKCGPRTPVLVNDVILPESGTVTRFEEHILRQVDISMMVVLGAKQRGRRDWAKLFKDADPRFQIVNVSSNPLGVGLLEFHLQC